MKRLFAPFLYLLLSGLFVQSAQAQSYLQNFGFPPFTQAYPINGGFVDLSNGNVHIEIPLGSFTQRGGKTLVPKFVYDSRIWEIVNNGSSQVWTPSLATTGPISAPIAGWRVTRGSSDVVVFGNTSLHNCTGGGVYTTFSGFFSLEGTGTARSFPVTVNQDDGGCPGFNTGAQDGFATDSSGSHIFIGADGSLLNIFSKHGSQLEPEKDSNGNKLLDGSSDTSGRTFLQTPGCNENNCNASAGSYQVLTSSGNTSTYTVTNSSVPATTAFGVTGVTEFSGTVQMISNISLPDSSSYQFGYDSYGELNSITFPAGGTITIGYSNFTDAYGNVNRWATSYTMSGGTWTYTPQVITTCPSGQQNCQQKVTVTKPSGDSVVVTFTMNGSAFPVQAQYFANGGTLLLTQTRDYDLSQTCSGCVGAAFVAMTRETNSLPSTGGATLINKTEYTYDSVFQRNVTAIKEWKFYTGTPSSTPDRETDIAYLTSSGYTNVNIIDRPISITTKDGSGNQVAQTLITYDSTALTSITGTTNHDDSFNTSYTVRGNPTLVKRWVTGTTFLSTTLTYDTTGQLIQRTDPAGNNFSFGYSDRYFNDNGGNPPASFTPTNPTNAYLTSVALPLVGSATLGYYFGSGKVAEVTDQNNAVSYSHYADSFDRSTLSLDPTGGWALTSYTSTTQTDLYTTLTDATPSTSCVNCRHDRYVQDNIGRLTSFALVNDPDGQINSVPSYDSSSRISSFTNPYRTTSEPTYGTRSPTYDGLDRVIQMTQPDGNTVTRTFAAGVTSATQLCGNGNAAPTVEVDEAGKKKQFWTDGFGQIIEVDEPDSGGVFSIATCSQYDTLGNLVSVTQRGGTTDTNKWRTRTYVFDGISRPTQPRRPKLA
ncbi:MAG TPA: hypothetical protein VG759_27515 [Candidatus Angelobacter sp.]|nr:hypothetical protein [Candidatus Angelobacter sp.]